MNKPYETEEEKAREATEANAATRSAGVDLLTMIATLACLSVVLVIPKPEISFDRLIAAIEKVESPNERNPWLKYGGAANWRLALWKQYTNLDYYWGASVPNVSREVMLHALTDFCRRYIAEGITPTHWLLATAWLKGYDGAKKVRRTPNDYGERATNLAQEKLP